MHRSPRQSGGWGVGVAATPPCAARSRRYLLGISAVSHCDTQRGPSFSPCLLPAPHPPPPQHISRRPRCCFCRHFALQHTEIPELQRKVASLEVEQEVRGAAAASRNFSPLFCYETQSLAVASRGIKLVHAIPVLCLGQEGLFELCPTTPPACPLLLLLVLLSFCAGTEAEAGRLREQPGCGRR